MGWNVLFHGVEQVVPMGGTTALPLVPEVVGLLIVLVVDVALRAEFVHVGFDSFLLVRHQLAFSALIAVVGAHAAQIAGDILSGH